jgi:hypothetical protein
LIGTARGHVPRIYCRSASYCKSSQVRCRPDLGDLQTSGCIMQMDSVWEFSPPLEKGPSIRWLTLVIVSTTVLVLIKDIRFDIDKISMSLRHVAVFEIDI